MARGSVNKVILVGNLGRDPEIRYTPTGLAVANLAIATSEVWKDKQSGENQERTEWHRIVMYQRLAEIAGQYLKKGMKVFIEGRLQTRKWQDKTSGQDRYSTEIIADSMQMLDGKGTNGDTMAPGNYAASPTSYDRPQSASTNQAAPLAATTMPESIPPLDNFDDEIPF